MEKTRIGQSTIEYVIMFAIIVGAITIIAWRFKGNVRRASDGLATKMHDTIYGK